MHERKPKYIGRRLISIGFIVTGLVLAATTVFMVWVFGEGLGATPAQQKAYAVAHVALHAFGMLVALSIAIFLIDRSKGWAALTIVLALGVGSYGISNIIGFSAKNRISVADAVRENDKRTMQRYEAQKADLAQKRDWAAGMSMSFEHSRYERLNFKKKEGEYQKMLNELKPPQVTASTVNADAGASVFSRFTGSTDEDWQVRFAIIIGVLMFNGEFFSFVLAGRIWPTAATVRALGIAADKKTHEGLAGTSSGTSGTSGGGSGSEPPRLTVVPKTEPEPAAIIAVAGTSSLAATTADAEAVGTSSPEPIVVPTETRMFQAPVAWAPHGRSSVDDADDRVSNGGKRVKAAAPKRKRKAKVPFDQMRRAVRASLVHGERTRTIRDIGEETGWSHTHVLRQIEREEGIQERKQKHLPVRRDPRGLGASLH